MQRLPGARRRRHARDPRNTTTASCASTRPTTQDCGRRCSSARCRGRRKNGVDQTLHLDGLPLWLEPEGRTNRASSRSVCTAPPSTRRDAAPAARARRVDAGSSSTSSCSGSRRALGGVVAAAYTHLTPAQRSLQMGLRGEARASRRRRRHHRGDHRRESLAAVGAHLEAGEVDAATALLPAERLYPLAVRLPTAPRRGGRALAPRHHPNRRLRAVHARRGDGGRGRRPRRRRSAQTRHAAATASCTWSIWPTPGSSGGVAASTGCLRCPTSTSSQSCRIAPQTNAGTPSPSKNPRVRRLGRHSTCARLGHAELAAVRTLRDHGARLWAVLVKAARRYALALALALGLERDYFERRSRRWTCARCASCTTRRATADRGGGRTRAAVRAASTPVPARSQPARRRRGQPQGQENRRLRGGRRGRRGGRLDDAAARQERVNAASTRAR